MADHARLGHRSSDVYIAGEVLHLGGSRLVPVVQRRIGVSRLETLGSWSGHADCHLVGVWVVPDVGTPHFLPAEVKPPDHARNWNAWLVEEPALLASIAARVARSAVTRPAESGG